MDDLALQVAEIHRVVVAQGQLPDPAGGQIQRRWRTQSAHADDQYFGVQQALLALDTDLVQQDMATIAQQLLVVHAVGTFMQKQGRFQESADYSALQMTRQRFCGAGQAPAFRNGSELHVSRCGVLRPSVMQYFRQELLCPL
jgi:hypothetical protein